MASLPPTNALVHLVSEGSALRKSTSSLNLHKSASFKDVSDVSASSANIIRTATLTREEESTQQEESQSNEEGGDTVARRSTTGLKKSASNLMHRLSRPFQPGPSNQVVTFAANTTTTLELSGNESVLARDINAMSITGSLAASLSFATGSAPGLAETERALPKGSDAKKKKEEEEELSSRSLSEASLSSSSSSSDADDTPSVQTNASASNSVPASNSAAKLAINHSLPSPSTSDRSRLKRIEALELLTLLQAQDLKPQSQEGTNENEPFIMVLDFRPVSDYCENHIKGAYSVQLPNMFMNRYRRGSLKSLGLEQFIMDEEGVRRWKLASAAKHVILYDAPAIQHPSERIHSVSGMLEKGLIRSVHVSGISYLAGGFSSFQSVCTNVKGWIVSSPTDTDVSPMGGTINLSPASGEASDTESLHTPSTEASFALPTVLPRPVLSGAGRRMTAMALPTTPTLSSPAGFSANRRTTAVVGLGLHLKSLSPSIRPGGMTPLETTPLQFPQQPKQQKNELFSSDTATQEGPAGALQTDVSEILPWLYLGSDPVVHVSLPVGKSSSQPSHEPEHWIIDVPSLEFPQFEKGQPMTAASALVHSFSSSKVQERLDLTATSERLQSSDIQSVLNMAMECVDLAPYLLIPHKPLTNGGQPVSCLKSYHKIGIYDNPDENLETILDPTYQVISESFLVLLTYHYCYSSDESLISFHDGI